MQIDVPEFLLNRTLPEEFQGKRYIDNFEAVLLSLVNDEGQFDKESSFEDFLFIITALEKIDHKIIVLEIIQNFFTDEQKNLFVKYGGYRLLRRWLKQAEEDNYMAVMKSILSLCKILPFDNEAVKQSEIGKVIKKLLKYQGKNFESTEELYDEVNSVMTLWKKFIAVNKKDSKDNSVKSTVSSIDVNEIDVSKDSMDIESPRDKTANLQSQEISEEVKQEDETISSNDLVEFVDEEPLSNHNIPSNPISLTIVDKSHEKSTSASSASTITTATSSSTDFSQSSANALLFNGKNLTLTSNTKERKHVDMLEGARKLLSMKHQAKPTSTATTDPSDPFLDSFNESKVPEYELKPLAKGGLKKKDNSQKKAKMAIRWADEEGGLLREVQMIEVDKIKSKVSAYKSHKDLVRKERLEEKEIHLSKTEDAMTRTTEWRTPQPLSLSIEVIDTLSTPLNSIEKQVQAKRISEILEAIYLDDSLIPNDPIESTDDNEESGDVSFTYIPWNLPDEVLEEEPVKETPKLYSNNLYTNNNNSVSSSSINYSANILNQRTDNDDAFIKSLPLHLQYLDPLALGILCQDKSIVQLILKPGEAVDDRYMNILQNSSTLEEFRASCNALANSDMYSPNPSWSVPPAQPASYGNQYSLTSTWDNSIFTAPIGNMSNPMPGMPSYSYQQPISVGINPHVNPISSVPSIHTSKLASRKASTPCRFFNTPKGCLSGDKCPFGHFGNISVPTYAPGGFRAPGSRRPAPGDANILTGEHPSKRFRK